MRPIKPTDNNSVSEELVIQRHGFSKRNPYTFFGEGPYLGFELEVDCEEAPDNFWNILNAIFIKYKSDRYSVEKDGTLTHGVEIVFQPHSLTELKYYLTTEFSQVLQELKQVGCQELAPKAGFHLHVSKTMFGEDEATQQENVAKIWKLFSTYSDRIIAIGHRTNLKYSEFPQKPLEYKSLIKYKVCKEWTLRPRRARYQAINVINKNTVEFRCFQSSLDLRRLNFWIDFVHHVCLKSTTITWEDAGNWDAWFSDFKHDSKLKQYIK